MADHCVAVKATAIYLSRRWALATPTFVSLGAGLCILFYLLLYGRFFIEIESFYLEVSDKI